MSNRNFDNGLVLGKRLIEISGSFGTNGSSSPAASSVKGLGFGYSPVNGVMTLRPSATPGVSGTPGIVRTATGTYTITLEDPYLDVNAFGTDLQVASASPNWCQMGPFSNVGVAATALTVQIFTINAAGSAVDIASGASSRVAFSLTLRDSTAQFGKP